jgi:hypothetical protein
MALSIALPFPVLSTDPIDPAGNSERVVAVFSGNCRMKARDLGIVRTKPSFARWGLGSSKWKFKVQRNSERVVVVVIVVIGNCRMQARGLGIDRTKPGFARFFVGFSPTDLIGQCFVTLFRKNILVTIL